MKQFLLITAFGLLSVACGNNADIDNKVSDNANKMALAEAKIIAKTFGEALKAELQKAMKEGGPLNTLGVCNTEAMPITEKSAKENNAQVSRVSLKNRNPNNIPNDWQRLVLEDFDIRAARGEDIAKIFFSDIVDSNGKKQVRFMKALGTDDVCLLCHGKEIAPAVQAKLSDLYPEDKATGYDKGQVRGAIVVVKQMN